MQHCPIGQRIISEAVEGWHLLLDAHNKICDPCRITAVLGVKKRHRVGVRRVGPPSSLTVYHAFDEPLSQIEYGFNGEPVKSQMFVRILKWGDNANIFIDVRRFLHTSWRSGASNKGLSFKRAELVSLIERGPEILAEYDRILEAIHAPDDGEKRQRLMGVCRQKLRTDRPNRRRPAEQVRAAGSEVL